MGINITADAAQSLRKQVRTMKQPDYLPAKAAAKAREVLAKVPATGLPPEIEEIRKQVEQGAANLERAVQEAVSCYEAAAAQIEASAAGIGHPDGAGFAAIDSAKSHIHENKSVQALIPGACMLMWWTAWLKDKYTAPPQAQGGD